MSSSSSVVDSIWALLKACDNEGGVGIDGDGNGNRPCCEQDRPCRHCGGHSGGLVLMDGFIVCTSCQSLHGRQMDHGAEWRFYGAEDPRSAGANPARCAPSSSGASNIQILGSVVSRFPRKMPSSWGKKTAEASVAEMTRSETGRQMQRLQVYNTMTYQDRVTFAAWSKLGLILGQVDMPSVIFDQAKSIYSRLISQRTSRGARREGIIAASIYVACKRCDAPRSIREIADMCGVALDVMTQGLRLVEDVMGGDNNLQSSEPKHFVNRFCSNLGLPEPVTRAVHDLVALIDERSIIYDAMPPSIVAGSILFVVTDHRAGGEKGLPANADIASTCQVALSTMFKIHKRIRQSLDQGDI